MEYDYTVVYNKQELDAFYNGGENGLYTYIVYRYNTKKKMHQEKVIYKSQQGLDSKQSYVKDIWKNLYGFSHLKMEEIIAKYEDLEIIGTCRTAREAYDLVQIDDLLR